MTLITLTFYDVVTKTDCSLSISKKEYIWSTYKSLRARMLTSRREYTLVFDGEVLNHHNKWSDYSVKNGSTIILLEKLRQSRFTNSASYNPRSSITPLLTSFSSDILNRRSRRLLPPETPPRTSNTPPPPPYPPPPPRRDWRNIAYRSPGRMLGPPPGVFGRAIQRPSSAQDPFQDFTDIQSILQSVIQNEEDAQSNENIPNNLSTALVPSEMQVFPPIPITDSLDSTADEDNDSQVAVTNNSENEVEENDERRENNGSSPSSENAFSALEDSEDDIPPLEDELGESHPRIPHPRIPRLEITVNDSTITLTEISEETEENANEPAENLPNSNVPSEALMVIDFYRSVYEQQIRQILAMGYTNEDHILEALMIHHGDIMASIDWMAAN